MESRYLIDWFSLTSKILSQDDWVNLLGFHGLGLKEIRGVHGFPNRLYYDGVNINFGDRGDGWVSWLELCGQGCRVFESYGSGDWDGLIAYFLNHQDTTHLTRMDVAFDDVDTNFLDMDILWRDAFEGEFVSKWRKGEVRHGLPKETGGRMVRPRLISYCVFMIRPGRGAFLTGIGHGLNCKCVMNGQLLS